MLTIIWYALLLFLIGAIFLPFFWKGFDCEACQDPPSASKNKSDKKLPL